MRKIIKTRAHFPHDDATKLIWLALRNITAEWVRPATFGELALSVGIDFRRAEGGVGDHARADGDGLAG